MHWRCALAILWNCLVVSLAVAVQPTVPFQIEPLEAEYELQGQASEADGGFEFDEPAPEPIVLRTFLVVPAVGNYGRLPLHRDAVEAMLVRGKWSAPSAGDEVSHNGQQPRTWKEAAANSDGVLDTRNLRGGYAYATVELDSDQVLILEAKGHAAIYVNGEPRAGDPYELGWLRVPVSLKAGRNEFLFHLASTASGLSARLVAPTADVAFDPADATLPDVLPGETESVWGAVPIINATNSSLSGLRIVCQHSSGGSLTTPVPTVPPLSVFKAPLQFPAASEAEEGRVRYQLSLVGPSEQEDEPTSDSDGDSAEDTVAELSVELSIADPAGRHRRTFRSTIDGSVQPYAILPAHSNASTNDGGTEPGLITTLHSEGAACDEFAARYTAKEWAHVLAPMGRRPQGFDWEDWGRIDALEALADVQSRYSFNPNRVALTGHSMGGHGVWHLGVTFPTRFSAIAPVSAWASFWSYGGGMPVPDDASPIDEMLARGYAVSDTLGLVGNLGDTAVCIVHGADDQVVPVSQARFMRSRLADFHSNFAYFELPEVGNSADAMSLDGPLVMNFLQTHSSAPLPEEDEVDFTTAHPGISHGARWISIEAQQEQLKPSRVAVRRDTETRTFAAKTINVARLALDVGELEPSRPVNVAIDRQNFPELEWPDSGTRLWFERKEDRWEQCDAASPAHKGPHRYGTFKSVFDNNVQLVYGTRGTADENAWALAKARFDAEMFWYRGNGALEVVADTEFRADAEPDRNVVLYGNAETNAAWPALLSTSPVQARGQGIRVGLRPEEGEDLAVLLVRPRPGSDRAMVGVVGGTGLVGMRLTTRLRYFVSGIAYPDLLIFGPGVLTEGTEDVRAAGYFGLDWGLESGDIVWRDVAM